MRGAYAWRFCATADEGTSVSSWEGSDAMLFALKAQAGFSVVRTVT